MTDFARTHTRTTDPTTSFKAAAKAEPRAGTAKAQILAILKAYERPLTFEEIARCSGGNLDRFTVARRLPDLEKSGHAQTVDGERETSTGSLARLWVAVH